MASETSIIPENIDIVMTHGPPKYILDDTGDGRSGGCEHLRRAICRAKPRLHCFGHIHRGYSAQRIEFSRTSQEDDSDSIIMLPKEFIGKNQARKKGYANLSPSSADAFRIEGQTLMVNAATMDASGEPNNAPWLVELDLPYS